MANRIGKAARESKGWWLSQRWLLLRRLSQLSILALFLAGPWFGLWLVKGNLNYSLTLNTLPLTDPYIALQSLLASKQLPERLGLIGVAVVVTFYLLVGGRSYCAWVCPINPITDLAGWLRQRLGIKGGAHFSRNTRYWMLGLSLLLAFFSGVVAWEWVNPVSMLHRGLIFGFGAAVWVVLAVFLLDLFVARRAWCGYLCPMGAFYSLIGRVSLLRVSAPARQACNDCMDCFDVCPEPQVIKPALKGKEGSSPVILAPACTNCGRCVDVCAKHVFSYTHRFNHQAGKPSGPTL